MILKHGQNNMHVGDKPCDFATIHVNQSKSINIYQTNKKKTKNAISCFMWIN